jgi:hypothetical protein
MQLSEWVALRKQLLDDFQADYERQRKRKQRTMFRPSTEWAELYGDFHQIYADPDTGFDNDNDPQNGAGTEIRTGEHGHY